MICDERAVRVELFNPVGAAGMERWITCGGGERDAVCSAQVGDYICYWRCCLTASRLVTISARTALSGTKAADLLVGCVDWIPVAP
jgi:hypothetical protein